MHIFKGLVLCLVMGLLLVSCSSMSKARKLMKEGSYEQARVLLVKVLSKNPSHKDALVGKRICEEEILNKKIVGFRDYRIAGSNILALDLGLEVVTLQKEWNFQIDIDSANFFLKETKKIYGWFRAELLVNLKNSLILKSEYDLNKYKPLFESFKADDLLSIRKKIKAKGSAKCQTLKNSARGKYFLASFANSYCKYFKVKNKYSRKVKVKTPNYFVKNLSSKASMKGAYSNILANKLNYNLKKIYKKSVWYHPRGSSVIKMHTKGLFYYSHQTNKEKRKEVYSIKVPYDAIVTQTKKTKDGKKYKEQVKVTKYKDVEKTFKYKVKVHQEKINISMNSKYVLLKNQQLSFSDSEEQESESHNATNKLAGISPKSFKSISVINWAKIRLSSYSLKWLLDLNSIWIDKYCMIEVDIEADLLSSGNSVIRCMRGFDKSYNNLIDNWHLQFTGLSASKAVGMLGRYHK